ncbi:putative Homeodomain-like, Homeodomain-related, Homeobox protein, partial [Trachipleistophora hominis]
RKICPCSMGRNSSFKAVKFIDSTHEVLRSYNKPQTSKRRRTKLTEEQLNILEESYRINHHPSSEIKEAVAAKIGIPIKNVQIWFQNRRAKDKSIKEHIIAESKRREDESYYTTNRRINLDFMARGNSVSTHHHDYNSSARDYSMYRSNSRNSYDGSYSSHEKY